MPVQRQSRSQRLPPTHRELHTALTRIHLIRIRQPSHHRHGSEQVAVLVLVDNGSSSNCFPRPAHTALLGRESRAPLLLRHPQDALLHGRQHGRHERDDGHPRGRAKMGFKDVETLLEFLHTAVHGVQDDSKLLLERVVDLLSKLPATSREGQSLESGLVHQLWSSLQHPVLTTLDEGFRYREADGSNNNLYMPQLGAAAEPAVRYAAAQGRGFQPHPNNISSVLFYLATIITHDIFQSDGQRSGVNLTSSYLDLAPLYGRNRDEQVQVRAMEGGRLKPDCFSSKRVHGFPPGSLNSQQSTKAVVSKKTLAKDLAGKTPEEQSKIRAAALAKYDEDLFQTGRLVTCGLYINIILRDYVRTILNVNRSDTAWALDPRIKDGHNIFSKPTAEATGNQVSVEFNFLYRWHSTVSPRDQKWTEDAFEEILGTDDAEAMGFEDFLRKLHGFEARLSDDPAQRPFHKVARRADGTLPDDDLVRIFRESHIEVLGIMQARKWNVATLNEFREFFGLTRHRTFEDINPDPDVARKLRNLYDSPDSVELGLCVNFTTSRAILSDAVALVRGDRFYTVDYTPKHLTNWGYNEASYDPAVDNSHVFYKLVYRAFPTTSAATASTPTSPHRALGERKDLGQDRQGPPLLLGRPLPTGDLVLLRSHSAITKVLANQRDYTVVWGDAIRFLTQKDGHAPGASFCLAADGQVNADNRKIVLNALYQPNAWETERPVKNQQPPSSNGTGAALEKKTTIKTTHEVDVVRDIINLANTRLCAAMFNLPIKIEDNPWGLLTEQELYLATTAIFSSIFFDADISKSLHVRTLAKDLANQIERLVAVAAHAVDKVGAITDAVETVRGYWRGEGFPAIAGYGHELIRHLLQRGKSSALLSQCVDFYLEDENKHHLEELYRLAHENTDEADEKLMRYMLEGSRIRGTVAVYRDVHHATTIPDSAPAHPDPADPTAVNPVTASEFPEFNIPVKPGDRLLLSFASASRDPRVFPDPETVRLDRPIDSYIHFGFGAHRCAGAELSMVAQTALFKQIVGLKNLRRAGGDRGRMKSMPARKWKGQRRPDEARAEEGAWTGLRTYMTPDQSGYWPVPSTMKLVWDE
ncbi:unnamed protein product [Parascedosporium putredinis]|uniref:linoleate 8R-lipoxygenase n=1 Tax=Parascedosporium putredinis TaxID=1442378 RepID=A0A9P1M8W2_9PEZI|nr:unnamed protein product [Parascedosporium putredinis]CAI7990690.1 unnamed protein product [Parascedosporium putredinis]